MFNPENWNWAVWCVVVINTLNVILAPVVHGRYREPHNGFVTMFSTAAGAAILYFGGLFA